MSSVSLQAATPRRMGQISNWFRDVVARVATGFKAHGHLYGLSLLVYVAGAIECLWLGLGINYSFVPMVSGSILLLMIPVVFAVALHGLYVHVRSGATGSPIKAIGQTLAQNILAPQRISNVLHALFINGLFFVGFVAIKKAIPAINPFQWDAGLMAVDKALHFGRLPHEWFSLLLASPEALWVLNICYNVFWFLGVMACLFWYGFAKQDSYLRQRFLLTYFSMMALGTALLGSYFSSVGPCFYGGVETGQDPYANLMAALAAANDVYPLWALDTQKALWSSYVNGGGDIEGISAMPSMHVATAVLFVLLANASRSATYKIVTRVFAALIFVGSIALGWHYAIDGYAGLALVLVCWWASGAFLRWRFPHMASV